MNHQVSKPGTVYIVDSAPNQESKLYTLDLATGKATSIGKIVTAVADIAFVGTQLYGLHQNGDKSQLIKIELSTGKANAIGNIGYACAGLAYSPQRNTLYASTAKQLIAINLETGKGTPVVTVADKNYNCGEVAFDTEGKAYITLIGYDKKKLLASCNLDTGEVNKIGNIGFADLASMEFVGDVLYGVTGNFFKLGKDGQFIRINTTTGKGTLVTTTNPISRWSGIAIYQPATVLTAQITLEANPKEQSVSTKSQEVKALKREKDMSILTIDTKNNCYVIDPDQMNNLQQNVASSFTFEKGIFDIKINSGRYGYGRDKTKGEPFVLLWIYAVDGSRFINRNTGFEVGATWTTLNGYNDTLKLEVKERTVLCALFFNFNNRENSGSVELLITSSKPFFNPHTLTVDSQRNSYVLDENYLSSLKQSGSNFIELNPGNYRLKIREGNASYWSDSKKFNIEPWALIWVKGGKVTTKLTGVEVEETWCSLNGLRDEVVLVVKEKTTLTGLFFDTHKDDNEGQIVVAIEPVSGTQTQQTRKTITTETVTNVERTSGSVSREPVGVGRSTEFTFRFNEDEVKKKWEEQWQQINASIKVIDESELTLEAKYWDQLEQWLLKNYEKHYKNLAIEVAKVNFTMDTYVQQMEFSLNQHLQGWSEYLDTLLEHKLSAEISKKINQQINQYIDQTFEQKIRNNIGLIINNVVNKQELNQYIDQHVDQHFEQIFEQKIRNNIGLIINNVVRKQELNQHIDQQVDRHFEQIFEQKIRSNIELIINNIVNKQELNQYIDRHVDQYFDQTFEQKVRNNVNVITQNIVNNNPSLNEYVSQQIDNTYEQKIQAHIPVITRNIVNNNQELNQYINQRLQHNLGNDTETNNKIVNLVINSSEINNKLNTDTSKKIENLRSEWNQTFTNLVTQHADELINTITNRETFNNVVTQKIINNNTELNQYISQQIHQNITNNAEINNEIVNRVANSSEINKKIDNLRNNWNQTFINLVTQHADEVINTIGSKDTFNRLMIQKLVNNNAELNQYISQQIQQNVSNNTEISNEIVNRVTNSTEINSKIDNLRNDWNQAFIGLVTQHVDELINTIGSRDTFNTLITQKVVNNNTELNQYISHQIRQNVTSNTEINNEIVNRVANSTEINHKIDNLRNDWNQTFLNLMTQHVDEVINTIGSKDTFNRLITQKIVNNNTELNQYIGQQIQQNVTNNIEINNDIVQLVANSTEINNKFNNVYRDIDTKIENVRNDWNQAFLNLVTQHVDELVNIIGDRETFNIRLANVVNVKVDELLNQILRIKNEMTVTMNNADRQLYEWTLGELMVIKGCLTDRQVLVEQLVTFSTELRTKLDDTLCVDIKSFKPFKPALQQAKQSE